MIDLSALPTSTGLTGSPDKPATQPGDTAQGADFLALLSVQSLVPGVAQPADPATGSTDPAILPPGVEPASPATALPPSGKILPPALPQLPSQPGASVDRDASPPTSAKADPPLARVLLARFRSLDPEIQEPAAEPAGPEPDAPAAVKEAEPVAAPMPVLPMSALPVLPADPAPPMTAANPAPAGAAALPHLPVQAAPLKPDRAIAKAPDRAGPQPANPQPVLTVQPGAAPLAAATLVRPQHVEARPVASLRVALSEDAARPIAAPEPAPVPGPAAPLALAPLAASEAFTPTPQAAPATRPHEFGALVDRLVQAREALQPQSLTMAVQHAEFGPVQLHFRHQESGLSVSLANPDPDFARAVSAAVPPVLAAPAGDGANLTSGQRQDAVPQSGSDSAGRQRGQSAPGRDERAPSANPARRSAPEQATDSTGQQGIFA